MKKIITIIFTILFIFVIFCFPASAAGFTNDLPDYVNFSGGAWFEVYDSVVGRCTVVFPVEFKNNIFGFKLSSSGLPADIINFSNTTIYGYVFTSSGKEYNCRASRFSSIEVQTSTSSYSTYENLSPSALSLNNSNMQFITDDINYFNDSVADYDKFQNVLLTVIALSSFFSLCSNLLRKGRR